MNDEELLENEGGAVSATQPGMVDGGRIDVFGTPVNLKRDKRLRKALGLMEDINEINEALTSLDEDYYSEEEILDNATVDMGTYLENNVPEVEFWHLSEVDAWCVIGDYGLDEEKQIKAFVDIDKETNKFYYTINDSEDRIDSLEDLVKQIKSMIN